ncbi:MAG: hypothetical protein Q7T25_00325 [Sideroxyarcus sp.]|nr:hypothetical protein [Sideroxyarcus sp.]
MAAALVAGCGGSSGDDNPGSGVTVGPPDNTANTAMYFTGERLKVVLRGNVTGHLDKLQGKTIYVIVEDPSGLFSPNGTVQLFVNSSTSVNYELTLNGKLGTSLTVAERLAGSLRIQVCLDAACSQPLGGSPQTYKYDLNVQDGITLSRETLNIEVPFGTIPPPETVGVKWSSFTQGYYRGMNYASDPNRPSFLVDFGDFPSIPSTAPQFQLVFNSAVPGTYETYVQMRAELRLPGAPTRNIYDTIKVMYTILPNPAIDHFFVPARSDFFAERKVGQRFPPRVTLNTSTGVTETFIGVEYLTGAGTTGPYQSWYFHRATPYVVTCTGSFAAESTCLKAGIYTAQLRYHLKTPTGERDVLYPITMTLVP